MEVSPPPPLCWSSIVKNEAPPQNCRDLAGEAGRVVGSCKSSKGITIAVVDANAVIRGGERLHSAADKFVSVSEVMSEIRDPVSRHKLAFLPFTVDPMEPSPESLKKVIQFARATGDLQTLSDVDLKLIALTYTLEAQIHGTEHLRDTPPPIHAVNVKRLPEKDMPGWGSNVPNLKEWEALEHQVEDTSNANSRILPLTELSSNIAPVVGQLGSGDDLMENGGEGHSGEQEYLGSNSRKPRRYMQKKMEVNIEGKKMVADGVDASQGEYDDNSGDWLPAVSRSTHRRFLRRKARREMYEASSEKGSVMTNMESSTLEETTCDDDQLLNAGSEKTHAVGGILEVRENQEGEDGDEDISSILKELRLEEDFLKFDEKEEPSIPSEGIESSDSRATENISDYNNAILAVEKNEVELVGEGLDQLEIGSQTRESVETSYIDDDDSSEQSWKLRSLSDSSVACVTSDFAMQNVILQMGLRLLAPEGVQIRQLQRWILKCHACYAMTAEIGRIFCPECGNGGTLRKVAVTVGENGIVQSARRLRVTLRGTKFSLPLPQGGRDAITKNPVLREDQLPHKVLYPITKKKVNKQGEETATPDDIFHHHNGKKAPLRPPVGKAVSVYFGKRNPNDNHFSRSKVK